MVLKNIFKSFCLLLLAGTVLFTGCDEEDGATPEMSAYFKTNIEDVEAMEAPADIIFTNASKNGLSYHWDFGDAVLKGTDEHTYDGISPDTVHYALPGTYDVRVTVKGSEGQQDVTYTETYTLAKKQPVISYTPESILNDTAVHFTVDFLRFPDSEPTFNWTFQDGEPATSTEENPVVQFQSGGDKVVTLELNDGEETLTANITVTVQSTLSPTLYFTDMDSKQIYMIKVSGLEDEEVQTTGAVLPDGSLPVSMMVDAGRIYYSLTDNVTWTGSALGEIHSFKWDGTEHKTVANNGSVQLWPSDMVAIGSDLYFTDRREGIYKINKNAENLDLTTVSIWMRNNESVYYGDGIGWGNVNGGLSYYDGDLYWSKCSNGKGVYTIDPSVPTTSDGDVVGGEKYLADLPIRALTIDQNTGKVYYFINQTVGDDDVGLYVSNADGSEKVLIESYVAGSDLDDYGGAGELLGVTGITILEDYVYWGYRNAGNDPATSGIKRAKLDGSEVEMFLPGYVPYGIVADPTPR